MAYCDSDIRHKGGILKRRSMWKQWPNRQNFTKEGICVSARRNSHCRITKICDKLGTGGWHPLYPTGKCTNVGKLWWWGFLPSLDGDKGYTAGITTYRSATIVTHTRDCRGKGNSVCFRLCTGTKLPPNWTNWEVELLKSQQKGGNTMARQKSIRFQMREALGKMAAYGTSKHEQRQLSKEQGVDLTKDKIFSFG